MRKLLLVVPMMVLLAAGCSSASSNTYQAAENAQSTPTPTGAMMSPTPTAVMSGSQSWQATLMQSDNSAKGQYMIKTGGHIIYLRTSKDFSSLVGKPVNVGYSGSLDSFSLVNITAQ